MTLLIDVNHRKIMRLIDYIFSTLPSTNINKTDVISILSQPISRLFSLFFVTVSLICFPSLLPICSLSLCPHFFSLPLSPPSHQSFGLVVHDPLWTAALSSFILCSPRTPASFCFNSFNLSEFLYMWNTAPSTFPLSIVQPSHALSLITGVLTDSFYA